MDENQSTVSNTVEAASNEWDYKMNAESETQETDRTRMEQEANQVSYRENTKRTVVSGVLTLVTVAVALLILSTAYLHNTCIDRHLQWKGTYCAAPVPQTVHVMLNGENVTSFRVQ